MEISNDAAALTAAPDAAPPLKTALSGKEGVCFIDVTTVEWMWESPWKSFKQKSCSGTGFILDSGKIMTCSHVVKYAIDVRVRRHGSARKFLAKVLTYAPDVDLALLEIVDENVADFFGPERPLRGAAVFSTEIPALQTRVTVCGYPTGGSTICLTEGVVSRVDDVTIAGCQDSLLMIQIDAAINSGNSGGPCYGPNGNVVGIAFAKSASGNDDNIGYILSAPIAVAFLGRVGEDGSYTIIPSVPYTWRKLENKSLRLAHIVPSHVHGVLLTSVCPSTQEYLLKGDVLMKIDDREVADDGQVSLRGDELIQHRCLLRGKKLDEKTVFSVFRNGKVVESGPCVLRNIPSVFPRWPDVDHVKDYLILGALVLLPLSYGITSNAKVTAKTLYAYEQWKQKWPSEWDGVEGLVLLTEILAHEVSFSYRTSVFHRVLTYDGIPVRSLRHLRDLWEETCAKEQAIMDNADDDDDKHSKRKSVVRLELDLADDIVFEVQAAMEAQQEILETHQIPKPWVISEPNPKYKFG